MQGNEPPKKWEYEALVEKTRLSIMLYLFIRRKERFITIQRNVGTTPGNLWTHLRRLQQAGMITIKNDLSDARSRIVIITDYGKGSVLRFADRLNAVAGKEKSE